MNIDRLRGLIRQKLSARVIAQKMRYDITTVRSAARLQGLKFYKKPDPKQKYLSDKAWVTEMYVHRGLSVAKIARHLKCSPWPVTVAIWTHKIPMKSRGCYKGSTWTWKRKRG